MTAANERQQLIADIRSAYAPSYGAESGDEDALHGMETSRLQTLRDKLVRLAEKSSQRVIRTKKSQAMHQKADAAINAALDTLSRLEKKLERDARMPVVTQKQQVPRAIRPLPVRGLEASWGRWVDNRSDWIDTQFIVEFKERLISQIEERLRSANLPADSYEELLAAMSEPDTQALVQYHAIAAQMEAMRLLRHRMSGVFARLDGRMLHRKAIAGFASDPLGLAFEPSVPSEPGRTVSPYRAAEGLARLQAYAVDYAADVIVVADNGGSMLGEFLASEMEERGSRPKIWFKGRAVPVDIKPNARFLILADVAINTQSIDQCLKLVTRRFAGGSATSAALVGSADLYGDLENHGRLFLTLISSEREPRLPWSRSGAYKRVEGGHLFGDGAEDPLAIPDKFLDVSVLFDEEP